MCCFSTVHRYVYEAVSHREAESHVQNYTDCDKIAILSHY